MSWRGLANIFLAATTLAALAVAVYAVNFLPAPKQPDKAAVAAMQELVVRAGSADVVLRKLAVTDMLQKDGCVMVALTLAYDQFPAETIYAHVNDGTVLAVFQKAGGRHGPPESLPCEFGT